jgi:hypothetical protein
MMRAVGQTKAITPLSISKNDEGKNEAYCKIYFASKYESILICYAMSIIIEHTEKNYMKY